jgi:hypothetical protein
MVMSDSESVKDSEMNRAIIGRMEARRFQVLVVCPELKKVVRKFHVSNNVITSRYFKVP